MALQAYSKPVNQVGQTRPRNALGRISGARYMTLERNQVHGQNAGARSRFGFHKNMVSRWVGTSNNTRWEPIERKRYTREEKAKWVTDLDPSPSVMSLRE